MSKIVFLSILMMCVTAPSRILPPFLLTGRRLPPFVSSVLNYRTSRTAASTFRTSSA